jgi:hypothetical protein
MFRQCEFVIQSHGDAVQVSLLDLCTHVDRFKQWSSNMLKFTVIVNIFHYILGRTVLHINILWMFNLQHINWRNCTITTFLLSCFKWCIVQNLQACLWSYCCTTFQTGSSSGCYLHETKTLSTDVMQAWVFGFKFYKKNYFSGSCLLLEDKLTIYHFRTLL